MSKHKKKLMECQRCFRVQVLSDKCKWCPTTKPLQLKDFYQLNNLYK